MDTADKIAEIGNLYVKYAVEHFRGTLEFLPCESPIERLLAAALFFKINEELPSDMGWDFSDGNWIPDGACYVIAQHPIGKYRADFFIVCNRDAARGPLKIVVECDGHDSHERTKEQAKRDRQRDRWLQSQGIMVLRFTGSEIWEDAVGCAQQVVTIITKNYFH